MKKENYRNIDIPPLIHGVVLKEAAHRYMVARRSERELIPGVFDKWYMAVLERLLSYDQDKSWEDSVAEDMSRLPQPKKNALEWDFLRLRLFLDRWAQGRFVTYEQRRKSAAHYVIKYGTEFGSDVLLTCQGAPHFMKWRGLSLMKTVFDFALYPQIISDIRPQTIFEIGSGSGASALWLADHLAMFGIEGHIYSVDIHHVQATYDRVTFSQGDCMRPESLFANELLKAAPHPWLIIEDAHHNVGAVLNHFHPFTKQGDYLVVEDSEIKQNDIHAFLTTKSDCYLVDTKYTDFFGRNATCALDSILVRATG